jgi:hypothetical protein
MQIHKKFIDKLAESKCSGIGEIILELGVVKKTQGSLLDAFHHFEELEEIFYTVDFLESKNFIEFGTLYNDGTTFPITSTIADPQGEELTTYGKMMMLKKYLDKYWGQEIIIKPIFYKYIKNGYKTDEEKDKDRKFWQAIIVALVASFATAVLTSYFSNDSTCLIKFN